MVPRTTTMILVACVPLLGCRGTGAPSAAKPDDRSPARPTIEASRDAAADGGAAAAATPVDDPTIAPLQPGARPSASSSASQAPPTSTWPPIDDANAWLEAHGVPASARSEVQNAFDCYALDVGSPKEPAIACTVTQHVQRGSGQRQVYRIQARGHVWAVRGAKLVTVLDVVDAVSPLDREDPDEPNLLDLRLVIAPDGLNATLGNDPRSEGCTHIPSASSARGSDAVSEFERFDRELMTRACAARGSYVWKAGRFVRTP